MGKLVSLSIASGAVLGLVALIRGRQRQRLRDVRLWALTAMEVVELLRQGKVSPAQAIASQLDRLAGAARLAGADQPFETRRR